MYQKILIATDGSELAGKAVDHGIKLAKTVGASLIFVTVTEIWSAIDLAAESERGAPHPMETYEAMAARTAQRILKATASSADIAGIACEILHVRDRAPAEGIIATAIDKGCDLIVMASHGRRGLNRMFLGSQTAEVLAHSKVPVLVLR
jgi:nucleotide-binding universal stress UspA family protein